MSHAAGTVGLVYTKGWAGRIIRGAQEGHWNHVVVARGDGQAYSAEPGDGLRLRPENCWADMAWLVNEPLTTDQGKARVAFLEQRLGAPYNYPAILTFSRWWLPLPKWFIKWANNRPNMICSESAALAARASGTDWFPGRVACTIAPASIDIEFRRRSW